MAPPDSRKLAKRATAAARRVTGFSTPIFGIQWQPLPEDRETIRALVRVLEDRRALTADYSIEDGYAVYRSVERMRTILSDAVAKLSEDSPATSHVQALRAACRHYATTIEQRSHGDPGFRTSFQGFHEALGALRAVFGLHLYLLSQAYGLALDPVWEPILPPSEE